MVSSKHFLPLYSTSSITNQFRGYSGIGSLPVPVPPPCSTLWRTTFSCHAKSREMDWKRFLSSIERNTKTIFLIDFQISGPSHNFWANGDSFVSKIKIKNSSHFYFYLRPIRWDQQRLEEEKTMYKGSILFHFSSTWDSQLVSNGGGTESFSRMHTKWSLLSLLPLTPPRRNPPRIPFSPFPYCGFLQKYYPANGRYESIERNFTRFSHTDSKQEILAVNKSTM